MAIYNLDGTDKEISVQGRYASVKNNGTETVYASSTPDLDLEAAEVVPIQVGESVVVRDCKKKLYVRGSGQIAVVSGNEPFNFFKPAPKVGSSGGGSGDGITQQQLNDTLKSYATNTGVDEKLAEYLPITDVGYVHVYGLMDTAFINSIQTTYNYEGFSVDGAGIGFPPEYVTYYYIKYISRDDMSGIQFAWDMTNKGWFFYRSYRGSNAVTSWGPWIKLPMMEDIPAIPDSLPADGGNADTVGGYKPGELIQDNPNIIINGNFRLNDSNKTDWTITGIGDYVDITTVNNWKIGASSTDQTVTASLSDTGLTITACAWRGVYQLFEMKMVNYLKSLFSQSVGKILATIKVTNITGEWQLSQLNGKHSASQKISTVGTHTVNFEWGESAYSDAQGLSIFNSSSTESTITIEWVKAFPIDVYAPDPNIEMLRAYGYSAFSNPNLLDNPDFQINQRRVTEQTTAGYAVDRWRLFSMVNGVIGTATPTDDGIKIASGGTRLSSYLIQYMENTNFLSGKKVTLSLEIAEISGSFAVSQYGRADNSSRFEIYSNGVHSFTFVWQPGTQERQGILIVDNTGNASCVIKWIKLEIGEVATPFVPSNPAEELLKCQRYYQRLDREMRHIGSGYVLASNTESFSFMAYCPLPTTMRVPGPTVTINGTLYVWVPGHYGTGAFTANRLASNIALAQNMLTIPLAIDSTDESLKQSVFGLPGSIQFRDTESYIEISADL